MAATTLAPKAEPETLIMVVYPSIAADAPGRLIGMAMYSIPFPFSKNLKLSALLFGLPLAPLGLALYALQKMFGQRYVLTNRSVQIWSAIGQRLIGEVPLSQIAGIEVHEHAGQEFYHAADLQMLDVGGNVMLTLAGVPRAEVFRQTILKARDARNQVEAALTTIGSRAR